MALLPAAEAICCGQPVAGTRVGYAAPVMLSILGTCCGRHAAGIEMVCVALALAGSMVTGCGAALGLPVVVGAHCGVPAVERQRGYAGLCTPGAAVIGHGGHQAAVTAMACAARV